jgi:hypothetical protein
MCIVWRRFAEASYYSAMVERDDTAKFIHLSYLLCTNWRSDEMIPTKV